MPGAYGYSKTVCRRLLDVQRLRYHQVIRGVRKTFVVTLTKEENSFLWRICFSLSSLLHKFLRIISSAANVSNSVCIKLQSIAPASVTFHHLNKRQVNMISFFFLSLQGIVLPITKTTSSSSAKGLRKLIKSLMKCELKIAILSVSSRLRCAHTSKTRSSALVRWLWIKL